MELAAASPPSDTITFSNVTLVRNQEGELSAWVGGEKMLGLANATIAQGHAQLTIPLTRVRFAEDAPATPVAIDKSNVLEFKNFRAAQLAVDNTTDAPTTDGDGQ